MIVLCNGMPRSASTWSYMVVMELLGRETSCEAVHGDYDEDVARFLQSAPTTAVHLVLKCHTFDAVARALERAGAAKVVYTWRDVADALVSFMGMFGRDFEHAINVMAYSLELYRFHRQMDNAVVLHYDEIISSPVVAVQRIATNLGLKPDPETVQMIVEKTSLPRIREKVNSLSSAENASRLVRLENTAYDPTTLLHERHIRDASSGYGIKCLTAEQLKQVEGLLERFL